MTNKHLLPEMINPKTGKAEHPPMRWFERYERGIYILGDIPGKKPMSDALKELVRDGVCVKCGRKLTDETASFQDGVIVFEASYGTMAFRHLCAITYLNTTTLL